MKIKLQKISTISSRKRWYELPKLPDADILFNEFFDERFLFPWNREHYLVDNQYYYVLYPENTGKLVLILNSVINFFMVEIYGRTGFGHGILQTYALEMKSLIVLNPDNLRVSQERVGRIIQRYSGHRPKSIFEEFGINPDKPIRNQEPEPLPDRVELDDVVFDELGLTKEERREVYWSVCELVKQRLEKAKG